MRNTKKKSKEMDPMLRKKMGVIFIMIYWKKV